MTTVDASAGSAVPTEEAGRPPIVALVCSAGGLEAVMAIVAVLPPSFPAAVVVLRHQSPGYPSRVPEILGNHCALPVVAASQGLEVRGGVVVVVPPAVHVLVTNENRLALIASDATPPYRPSADLLLTSLALVAADRTIAVVLSGGGHDGATGASALHDMGGLVLASDEQSSKHFDMPAAAIARHDAVDFVLPVSDIGAKLMELVENGHVSQPT